MFTLGNELGRNEAMYELVAHFQEIDPRRLYAQGSNNMSWDISVAEGDDFWVTSIVPGEEKKVRGSYAAVSVLKGIRKPHIDSLPPSTMYNYTNAIQNFNVPVISHEIGQFQVSPDFNDIPKFTGVTRARNYEIFRERFDRANLLDQADDFVKASGKLAVICYREDIEAALRTPDFAGFQLLDIQDFPGQGTALVGVLNDFMESKGLITPEEWSQFCSEVVPLLKMEKYTWTNNEKFRGNIEIAHYGKDDFKDAVVSWKLKNSNSEVLAEGSFREIDIAREGIVEIGEISFPFNQIEKAEKLRIEIAIGNTKYQNDYGIWVYPQSVDTSIPKDILVSERLDVTTIRHLENGGKAIIIPNHDKQTIDNFDRNHKLGMIFETKYGKGSALICAIDLLNLQDKPEARQLYYSILNYVNLEDFVPEKELSKDLLSKIIQ